VRAERLRSSLDGRAGAALRTLVMRMMSNKQQRRRRQPSLSQAIKQARRAGQQVTRATLYDDHIELMFGETDLSETTSNPWDHKINNADQKRPS
jgi:hypothetical protein